MSYTSGGTTEVTDYTYDANNRLTSYNSGSAEATYMYDADNLRASKTVNRAKTDFVWDGQNLATEHKSDATNTYAYDMTGVHIANQDGVVTSYLKDFHGNIVGKTTAAGAMVQELNNRMDYDAFGNQWIGETPNPFGYCGEYYDNESGLIYLRNRYYDTSMGRFITEDPIKDGLNWYSYCAGNPVVFKDKLGLWLDGDELLSSAAQAYTRYYGDKWSEANQQYQNAMTDDEKVKAKQAMDFYHAAAGDVRILDAQGRLTGKVLDVEKFDQYDVPFGCTGYNLCWATCISMAIAFYKGDVIDRKMDIAMAVYNAVQNLEGYDFPREWYSTDWFLNYNVSEVQTQIGDTISMDDIVNITSGNHVFGALYGANDANGNWSGHWVLGIGSAVAPGHVSLVVSNDPANGVQRIQSYDDFTGDYVGDVQRWRPWVDTAY